MNALLLKRFETFCYLLLVFLIPTQFGKHFWPEFSFIGGLRVDYLSPTLYTTDILIVILFLLTLYRVSITPRKKKTVKRVDTPRFSLNKKTVVLVLGISSLCFGILFAKNQPVAMYGTLKLLEMIFFCWYTARVVGKTMSVSLLTMVVAGSVVLEASLSLLQFYKASSMGGVFYYVGERTFSSITPGIANASLHGRLLLRPYGTLPHPNVLAGFLLLAILFIAGMWQSYTSKQKWFVSGAIFLGGIAILFSLSRIAILFSLMLVVFFVFRALSNWKQRIGLGVVLLLGIVGMLGTIIGDRFTSSSFLEESFLVRVDLLGNAWWMITHSPLFGVGLLNFLVNLPSYQHTQNFYLHLQPVHNIFALLLAEVGVLGFSALTLFLITTILRVKRVVKTPLQTACFFMLGSIGFLGLFDHYFLTLQQGQLLLAFTLGLCWSMPLAKQNRTRAKANRKILL